MSPRERLMIPAILLLVCEIPWELFWLVGTISQIAQIITGTAKEEGLELIGGMAALLLFNAVGVAIIVGAVDMLRMHSYRSARLGAILSILPLCGPCMILGLPFGIWALILLLQLDVKAAFAKP
jgi:hypothetical protein